LQPDVKNNETIFLALSEFLVRQIIRWLNCEDILMNFVAVNATGLSPLALGSDGQCLELMDVSALRQSFPEVRIPSTWMNADVPYHVLYSSPQHQLGYLWFSLAFGPAESLFPAH
jgi:hypothetical protein